MSAPIKLTLSRIGKQARLQLASSQGEANRDFDLPWLDVQERRAVYRQLQLYRAHPESWDKESGTLAIAERMELLHEGKPSPSRVAKIGKELYEAAFGNGKIHEVFKAALASVLKDKVPVVQLRFDAEGSLLASYPWELLHDEDDFLFDSRRASLARYVEFADKLSPIDVADQLSVLLVAPRPSMPTDLLVQYPDLPPLDGPILKLVLAKSAKSIQVLELEDISEPSSTFQQLGECLTNQSIHILHFDGHGAFGWVCPECKRLNGVGVTQCQECGTGCLPDSEQGYLAFEQPANEHGIRQVKWVSGMQLGKLLHKQGVQLVVLSACKSGLVGGASAFNSVAGALIQAGIPAVVAMQFTVEAETTKIFVRSFYRALAAFQPVAEAMSTARVSLLEMDDTWYRPVLYLRTDDSNSRGMLFEPRLKNAGVLSLLSLLTTAMTILGCISDLFQVWEGIRHLSMFAFALVLVLSVAVLWQQRTRTRKILLSQDPKRILNKSLFIPFMIAVFSIMALIALVGFGSSEPPGPSPTPTSTLAPPMDAEVNILIADFAEDISACSSLDKGRALSMFILGQLERAVRSELGKNDREVALERTGPVCTTEKARAIGLRLNANLVIWGWIPPSGVGGVYEINFVVIQESEAFEVGTGLSGSVSGDDASQQLAGRAQLLVLVLEGLVEYLAGNQEKAIDWFEQALTFPEIVDENPKVWAAITMYKGRSLAAVGRTGEALDAFKSILEKKADYSWAHVGIGAVYYAQAVASDPIDCEGLTAAAAEYGQATVGKKSIATYVDAKAHYSLGSVYLVQGQRCVCEDCYRIALEEYRKALVKYQKDGAPGEYTSKVHYGLGGVYHFLGDDKRAIEEFQLCIEQAGNRIGMIERCEESLRGLTEPTSVP